MNGMHHARRPAWLVLLMLLLAVLVLLPGTGQVTSVTGKDEYLLALRTPLHMLEGEHGWEPWLDGQPRLQKPPLVYWLGKLSYQAFGVSLLAGRTVGILSAALLVAATSLFAWLLTGSLRHAALGGLVLLGSAGIMVDGRRLLLDIPVALFSMLAVMLLYLWQQRRQHIYALLAGVALGLAFLSKGPVTLIFVGAGFTALLLSHDGMRDMTTRYWPWLLLALSAALAVAVPWFVYIYSRYPQQLVSTLGQEFGDRDWLRLSLTPLLSLLLIAMPWAPAAFRAIFTRSAGDVAGFYQQRRFLLIWLVLSLLPFFLFKSFGRYLYGCLVPLVLLLPTTLAAGARLHGYRNWLRAGAVLSAILGVLIMLFVAWFRGPHLYLLISLLATVGLLVTWWQSRQGLVMAATAVLYWAAIIGLVYPLAGINAVSRDLVESVENEYVVLFAGPQPAMLPMASGRGLRATSRLWTLPQAAREDCRGIVVFSPTEHLPMAQKQMQDLAMQHQLIGRFHVLSSRGSWLRFVRRDVTIDDWRQAMRSRDIDSLGISVTMFRARPAACP
jgi:4-amino-4-deoxy-L-arabinose transferase-like glycosyltransferase